MEYHLAIEKQRAFFLTGATRPIGYRLRQLKLLKGAIQKYEAEILEALCTDLGKPAFICERQANFAPIAVLIYCFLILFALNMVIYYNRSII